MNKIIVIICVSIITLNAFEGVSYRVVQEGRESRLELSYYILPQVFGISDKEPKLTSNESTGNTISHRVTLMSSGKWFTWSLSLPYYSEYFDDAESHEPGDIAIKIRTEPIIKGSLFNLSLLAGILIPLQGAGSSNVIHDVMNTPVIQETWSNTDLLFSGNTSGHMRYQLGVSFFVDLYKKSTSLPLSVLIDGIYIKNSSDDFDSWYYGSMTATWVQSLRVQPFLSLDTYMSKHSSTTMGMIPYTVTLGTTYDIYSRVTLAFGGVYNATQFYFNGDRHIEKSEYALGLFAGLHFDITSPRDSDHDGVADYLDKCLLLPEDIDQYLDSDGCPEYDNDGDGVHDAFDTCPFNAEDKDGYNDADGCPEVDNDTDGILDAFDACPLQPEDWDTFEDNDGCPDFDNDGDNIADSIDACIAIPEDVDGYEDFDGCPEYDNDQDGIIDSLDACPLSPETVNTFLDSDGCPDVLPKKDTLRVLSMVHFNSDADTLDLRTIRALEYLIENIDVNRIVNIQLAGHTDSTNTHDYNYMLSMRRVKSVCKFFEERGVAKDCVTVKGHSFLLPATTNHDDIGRSLNRRVEIIIILRAL